MKFKQHFNPWFITSLFICGLLLLLQLLLIQQSPWTGDYWEHKAVLRELTLHLHQPSHPILNVNVPHAFFSPYMVLLGGFASITCITAASALNIAMMINLLLFFTAVYLLVKLFVEEKEKHTQGFVLALLSILFFWGPQAPLYSSFFHFRSFILTLSYPSTFAFICSVYAAFITRQLLITKFGLLKKSVLFLTLSLLLCIVLLTHPLTFIFAAALLLNLILANAKLCSPDRKTILRSLLLPLCATVLSFSLAGLWPYYSFFSLLRYSNGGNQFHTDSIALYHSLLFTYYPFIIIPFIVIFNSPGTVKKELPLTISIISLLLIFTLGYYSKSFALGRTIAAVAVFGHFFLVKMLLQIKTTVTWIALAFLLAIPYLIQSTNTMEQLLSKNKFAATDSVNFLHAGHSQKAKSLAFLETFLQSGSPVILTDLQTGLFVPAMGGKVVASVYPAYWVADAEERKEQVQLFFSENTTQNERISLIKKYSPDYILLTPSTSYILIQLSPFIHPTPIAAKNGITLYKVKQV